MDLAAVGLAVGGLAGGSTAVGVAGLAGMVLGGPLVHFAHGNVGNGFASLGLRTGLPAAGTLLMGGLGGIASGLVGGVVGYLVAVPLDASLLAYDLEPIDVGAAAPAKPARRLPAFSLVPTLDAGPGRLGLGAAGTF